MRGVFVLAIAVILAGCGQRAADDPSAGSNTDSSNVDAADLGVIPPRFTGVWATSADACADRSQALIVAPGSLVFGTDSVRVAGLKAAKGGSLQVTGILDHGQMTLERQYVLESPTRDELAVTSDDQRIVRQRCPDQPAVPDDRPERQQTGGRDAS